MIEVIFWASVFLVAYPYVIYPLLILVLGWIRPRPVKTRAWQPAVTVLIPAYNEADCIRATVQNKLEQNYPREKLQIIVVSDGSSDGTDDIVKQFSARGVQLLRTAGRAGGCLAFSAAASFSFSAWA